MSLVFSKKKKAGSLVALIDIESGSVGAALAYIEQKKQPRLFAQRREAVSARVPAADALFHEIERRLEDSFLHLNDVSLRTREHLGLGDIERVAVFLHSPWVASQRALERVVPRADDALLERLRGRASGFFDTIPVTFHSFSTTVTPVLHGIFSAPQEALVCSIGGEVTEIAVLRNGKVESHATVPVGLSTVLRTIESHSNVSRAEAQSILSLTRTTEEHMWAEAIASAMRHFAARVREGIDILGVQASGPQQVFVVSPHSSTDWFARTLTKDASMHEFFSPGSTVRAISEKHLSPHLASHPRTPDVPLTLESLFVDTRFAA